MFKKIKEVYDSLDEQVSTFVYGVQDAYLPKGYIHKWVFRLMIACVILVCVIGYFQLGGLKTVYVSCPNTTISQQYGCVNPIHLCSVVPEEARHKGIVDFSPLADPYLCYESPDVVPFNACKYGYCDEYKLSAGQYYGESQTKYNIAAIIIVIGFIIINHGVWMYENRNKTA
jgi:hypothetical protein